MATISSLPVRRSSRSKQFLFASIALATLFVLYHNERFVVDHRLPDWTYFYPIRGWLLLHGLGGSLAVFLGPLQFSTRLRQNYLQLHRVIGYCYLTGIAIAAPMSVYIEYIHDDPPFHAVTVVQAASWLLTTSLAFYFVKQRKIQQHRQWMMRSYAVTLIFVEVRTIYAIPFFAHQGAPALIQIIWFCNVMAWLVPTLILQWRDFVSAKLSRPESTDFLPIPTSTGSAYSIPDRSRRS